MPMYQLVVAIVLGIYVGFARLNQLRFIAVAMHFLAFPGFAARQYGPADIVDPVTQSVRRISCAPCSAQ